MFTTNHFAELSASIPPSVMQAFVIIMILLVIGGTLFDVIHKRSATYFFNAGKKAKKNATRDVSGGEKISVVAKTTASEILTSSEFCNPKRRIAHLLGMYGFVIYLVATMVMVFGYPTDTTGTPAIWPFLWAIGALMVCVGGYWFWFFIRVKRNIWPVMGVATICRQCIFKPVPCVLFDCLPRFIRWCAVVKIRTYVLQACCSNSEKAFCC